MGRSKGSAAQQRMFAEVATADEHEADLREREDDPTPREAARAVISAAIPVVLARLLEGLTLSKERPLRVLDVCAGYGCWASEFARYWVHVLQLPREWLWITAVEVDERKAEDLRRWCDEVLVGCDWTLALDPRSVANDDHYYDIAIGNPPFTALTAEDPAESMPALLLDHSRAVLLWHTQQAFVRGADGRAIWRRYPPAHQWTVPGPVSHRSDGKTDSRCYATSLWLPGHEGSTQLDMVEGPPGDIHPGGLLCWRWSKLPGTESAGEARVLGLPLAPGYQEAA